MNYRDVAALNQSLDSLSDNLLKRKMMQQQAAEKQQQFGIEQTRADTEGEFRQAMLQHYKNMEEKQSAGSVNTWLTSEDGGAMNFQGPPAALEVFKQKAEEAGKPLTTIEAPTSPAPYAEITKEMPGGIKMTFHTRNQNEANQVMGFVGKMPTTPPVPPPGPIANDQAAAELEAQRDQLNQSANERQARIGMDNEEEDDTTDNVEAERAQAATLDTRAKFIRGQGRAPVRTGEIDTIDPRSRKVIGKTYQFGQPGAAAPVQPGAMVRVQHPDGRTGVIPAANLAAAQQAGFKVVPQTPAPAQ